MDRIKELILKTSKEFFGTTPAGFFLRVVIALLALYTGSSTSVGDAVGLALDKDRSIAVASELLNETPSKEVSEAVAKETE